MNQKNKNILIIIIIVLIIAIVLSFIFEKSNKEENNLNIKDSMNSNFEDQINNETLSKNIQNITINNLQKNNLENKNMEEKKYTQATINTNFGNITFEFVKSSPNTVNNFIKLASSNFYNDVKFHRVIKGFMIQTGDPQSKDNSLKDIWGTGGPGYKFNDELSGNEKYSIGTVAMANSGPNTNGSQFFIMTSNTPLPPNYTIFGKVISGQDVAQKIQDVNTDERDRPIQDIIIKNIELK